MKTIFILVLIALVSCNDDSIIKGQDTGIVIKEFANMKGTLKIYTIDSCEYIGTNSLSSDHTILTHKGNCKYCLQRNGQYRGIFLDIPEEYPIATSVDKMKATKIGDTLRIEFIH